MHSNAHWPSTSSLNTHTYMNTWIYAFKRMNYVVIAVLYLTITFCYASKLEITNWNNDEHGKLVSVWSKMTGKCWPRVWVLQGFESYISAKLRMRLMHHMYTASIPNKTYVSQKYQNKVFMHRQHLNEELYSIEFAFQSVNRWFL